MMECGSLLQRGIVCYHFPIPISLSQLLSQKVSTNYPGYGDTNYILIGRLLIKCYIPRTTLGIKISQ